jgi:hypothetical protein
MTLPEQYRTVFRSPGGEDVLADLSRYIQRLPEGQRGPASLVMLRIMHMLHLPDAPARVRGVPASGGRIQHA